MSQIPPAEQYHKLFHRMANYFYPKVNKGACLEYDDLVGECGVAYCHTRDKFDASKGCKFITLLHLKLRQHLSRVVTQANKKQLSQMHGETRNINKMTSSATGTSYWDALPDYRTPDLSLLRNEFYKQLSQLAFQFITELISPSDAYQQWHDKHWRNQTQLPQRKINRVSKYFNLTRVQRNSVVKELQEALVA